MTPTSPPKTEAAGFTLMEMLVVLAVMAIIAAIAIARLPNAAAIGQRERAAVFAREALLAGRSQAMAGGREVSIETAALAAKAANLSVRGAAGEARLTFFPDGSASGGEVLFAAAPLLKVDWLTGGVSDAGGR